ncbi:MAG TPA: diguanylate cyclase, partial [Gammaproteobacteria bacterium]|nr:diguanylate cyclase [Gammaproteobacteria bacterium]
KTLLGTLKTLMLNGDGTLAREWLDRLDGVAGIRDIEVLRRDGNVAFTDLSTVEAVNNYLGQPRFQRARQKRTDKLGPVLQSVFDKARQGQVAYDLSKPGIVTIMQPIKADPECLACHGYDSSMLRGILKLSLSSQATVERVRQTQSAIWVVAVLLVVILGFSLWFSIRLSVIRPISALRNAIMSAGEGDRSAQIPVKRQDELGELSLVFNQMQKDLAQGEARIRAVMDNVADGIITISEQGIIDKVNPAMAHIFGYSASELVGQHVNMLIPEESRQNRDAFLLEDLEDDSGKVIVGVVREIIGKKKNGAVFPMDLAISDMRLGDRYFYIGIVRDITSRKARIAALHYQAMHDALTGLPNRTLLMDRLQQAIRVAGREEHKLALILLDLDRFKAVNDTLGHHVGDKLLQQIAQRLKSVLRESDTVARLGGDEFCLLLPASHVNQAMFIARKVINAVEKTVFIDGVSLSVGASLGIASFPEHGDTPNALLQRADVAMYEAKRNKLGFSVYDPKTDKHSLRQLAISSELKDAINNNQLLLHYQPKVDLKTNTLNGIEALVRW